METVTRYVLTNEKMKIEISEIGAELKSMLTKEKIEYMWTADAKFWSRTACFLFPIVGTLKDKKTIINGVVYPIMQHGFLRDQKFSVSSFDENSITLVNEYSDATLKLYPFKYQVKIKYTLCEKSLNVKVEVHNLGSEKMPFNFGGHPGFNCPLYLNEKFEDYSIYFEEEENFSSPVVMSNATLDFSKTAFKGENLKILNLKKDLFDIDTIIIKDVKSKSVKLLNKDLKGIKFDFPKFKTLAIWTPFNDAPFICLEPWIGYNDRSDSTGEFIDKDDLIILKDSEVFDADYTITIID